MFKKAFGLIILCIGLATAACQLPPVLPTTVGPTAVVPTLAHTAPPIAVADHTSTEAAATVPPTWTPDVTELPPLTSTLLPTVTATLTAVGPAAGDIPTYTPIPSQTAVPIPTSAPATTQPPATSPTSRPSGANLLPNPSFEEGHYNLNGLPELQLPNRWLFEWDEGATGYGNEAWDVWVRPETRVLSTDFLPVSEHSLYIWDGQYTVKIFKGYGAISFRLLTDVALESGNYLFEVAYFPDLVEGYNGEQKIWAHDPLSGEIRLIAGGQSSGWILPKFGQRHLSSFTFTVDLPQTVRLGIGVRGRHAIVNNGWFMDNWSLRKLE